MEAPQRIRGQSVARGTSGRDPLYNLSLSGVEEHKASPPCSYPEVPWVLGVLIDVSHIIARACRYRCQLEAFGRLSL